MVLVNEDHYVYERDTKHLNKGNTKMSYVDQYDVIDWVNQLMESINQSKEKLQASRVLLARRKAGVENLPTRDLQQRVLDKIIEQRIGLELMDKSNRLFIQECRWVRKELSRSTYASKRWIETHQVTDKESLRKLIKQNVEKANADHFKELKDYQDKLKKKSLRDKAA